MSDTTAAIVVACIGATSALAGVVLQRGASARNAHLAAVAEHTQAIYAAQHDLIADLGWAKQECMEALDKAEARIVHLENEVDRLNSRIVGLYRGKET